MHKSVPFRNGFKTIGRLNGFLNILLYATAIVSVAILSMSKLKINIEGLDMWLNRVLALFSVIYFIADIVQRFLFHNAESERKKDLIDNGLGTHLSEENTKGYFSNDDLGHGIFKLGVDAFENSFFTKSISGKMLKKQFIFLLVIVVLFFFIITLVKNDTIVQLLLLALPYSILMDTIRLYILHGEAKRVFEDFKSIFSTTKKNQIDYLIIHNLLSYEKTVSWASIKLDSKVFKTMNKKLSQKWSEIKAEHGI